MYIVKKYGQAQISGLGKKGTRGATKIGNSGRAADLRGKVG